MAGIELTRDEAVDAVTDTARRLFPIVSEQRARQLAELVLRDLEARGIRLIQDRVGA